MAARQASGKAGRGSEPGHSPPALRPGTAALTENQNGARAHHRGGTFWSLGSCRLAGSRDTAHRLPAPQSTPRERRAPIGGNARRAPPGK